MRISDWSSDVCSSDLLIAGKHQLLARACRNIYGADFLHIYDLYRVERRGKAPVNARPHGSGVATKPRQHAALLWADAMDAGQRDPDNREYYGQHGPEPLAFRPAGNAQQSVVSGQSVAAGDDLGERRVLQ